MYWKKLIFLLLLVGGMSAQTIQGVQLRGVKLNTTPIAAGAGSSAIQFVGTPVSAHASSGTNISVTYTPVISNDTICASITWNTSTGSITSVTASAGNNMTHAGLAAQGNGFNSVDLWCSLNAGTAGAITYQANTSFTITSAIITITEYSGVLAFGRNNAVSSGITSTYSDNLTTANNNNVVIAAVGDNVADAAFNVTSGTQRSSSVFNNQLIVADASSPIAAPLTIAGNTGTHAWGISLLELSSIPAVGGTGIPIAFVGTANHTAAAVTSISVSYTPAATTNTVCALINWKQINGAITSVNASVGNNMTHAGALAVGNGAASDIWCALTAGSTSSITYTAALSITADMNITIVEYSGVSAFGVTNHINSASTSGPFTLSLTTQENGNWVVGSIGIAVQNASFAVTTGNTRANVTNGTGMESIAADNTSANAGAVTIAGNTGGHSWTESLLELMSTPGSGGLPPPPAAIEYVGFSDGQVAAASSIFVTHFAANANNTVCALINWKQTTGTVTGITNSAGNALTHVGSPAVGNGAASDIWCALTAGTTSSIVYTASLSVTADINMAIVEYSGVAAFGTTNSLSSSDASGPFTLSLNTQDNGNFVIGTIGIAVENLSFALTNGVQRVQQANGTGMDTIAADNTAANAGVVTIAGTTGSHSWTESLLELRLSATTGGGGGGTTGFTPTTTLTALTTNNTSASSSFTPVPDPRAGILTPTYEIVPGNTSKVSPFKMLYSGATTEIYPNFLDWFKTTGCSSSRGGVGQWSVLRNASGNHFCIGYNSADASQVHKQINDMMGRGYQGLVFTWEGVYQNGTTTFTTSEATLQLIKADLEARCTGSVCPFHLIIMFDGSELPFSKGFAGSSPTADCCTINSAATETAFTTHLKDDMCYLNKNYFGSPVYRKLATGSGIFPIVQSFIIESGTRSGGAPSWADLWNNMNTFDRALNTKCPTFSSGFYTGEPNNGIVALYFGQSSSAFTQDGLTNSADLGPVYGAFSWESGSSHTDGVAGQTSNEATNISSVSSFYTKGQSETPNTQTFGSAWAKFNDQLAGWSPNPSNCGVGSDCTSAGRVVDNNCAKNWVASWSQPVNSGYFSGKQLPFIQLVTWNDYDEGTEIETGIDNCYTVTSPSISGTTFSWTMSDSTSGSASKTTIDHFTLWLFDGAGNAMDVLDVNTPTATSLTIPSSIPAGTWRLGVQMVGVNSVKNSMSPLLTYVVGGNTNTVPSSSHVVIVVEENHSFSQVIGNSSMPYINSLATTYGLATQFFAVSHPSIGNYFALTTGEILTTDDNFSGTENVDNIVRRLLANTKTWKAYMESIPSIGYTGFDSGTYLKHHNPFAYLTDVVNDATQKNNMVPFTQFATDLSGGTLPNYSFISPNVNDDAHNGTLAAADTWLSTNINPLLSNSQFTTDGILVIVFDESVDTDTAPDGASGGHVAMLVVGPKVTGGHSSTTQYFHYSILRMLEEALGLSIFPGNANTAGNMAEFFH